MPSFNATTRTGLLLTAAVFAFEPFAAGAGAMQRSDRAHAPGEATRADLPAARAGWEGVQVVVYKSARRLAVYRDGNFVAEYRVVLGLVPLGGKRHANDARTPEGRYHVTEKRRHARWQHFLAIDYPNDDDRERYEAERKAGRVPVLGGAPVDIGGAIGIHGNDRSEEQERGVDWTKGCVALSAGDITEIAAAVPVGAEVWILP